MCRSIDDSELRRQAPLRKNERELWIGSFVTELIYANEYFLSGNRRRRAEEPKRDDDNLNESGRHARLIFVRRIDSIELAQQSRPRQRGTLSDRYGIHLRGDLAENCVGNRR